MKHNNKWTLTTDIPQWTRSDHVTMCVSSFRNKPITSFRVSPEFPSWNKPLIIKIHLLCMTNKQHYGACQEMPLTMINELDHTVQHTVTAVKWITHISQISNFKALQKIYCVWVCVSAHVCECVPVRRGHTPWCVCRLLLRSGHLEECRQGEVDTNRMKGKNQSEVHKRWRARGWIRPAWCFQWSCYELRYMFI